MLAINILKIWLAQFTSYLGHDLEPTLIDVKNNFVSIKIKKVSTRLTFLTLYESQTIFDSQTTKIKSQTLLEYDINVILE